MEINHLKDFVILAQTGSFQEAADELSSSQSTLSKHIRNLELELGISLFDRTTRKMRITQFGQALLPYAEKIVELQGKYNAILQGKVKANHQILTLGSIPGCAEYKIKDVLAHFKKSHPQLTYNLTQGSTKDLTVMLRQKKCELAFIRDIEDTEDEFIKIPYATDTIVAVLPITHPLAGQKTIPLRMLADDDFVLTKQQTMPHRLSINACKLSGFEPKVVFTDHEVENLVDLVINGKVVSLLLKKLVLYLSNPKIAIVDISPSISTQISLCYLKDVELSDAAKQFLLIMGSQGT
jgi:LysR family transcriptional regulator, transcription activator of glutamate synthase operon